MKESRLYPVVISFLCLTGRIIGLIIKKHRPVKEKRCPPEPPSGGCLSSSHAGITMKPNKRILMPA
jgi:hypothetical protein